MGVKLSIYSENLKIDPLFLPIARPHPLNTLTHVPPPMYWLGISNWCLGPLCMLHSVWVHFFLAFIPFMLPRVCLILLFVLVGVLSLVVWRMYGLLGSCPLPFILSLDWALLWVKALIFLPSLCSFFPVSMGLLPVDPAISLHHAYYNFSFLFISCYLVGLWLMLLPCQPTSLSIFCSGLR